MQRVAALQSGAYRGACRLQETPAEGVQHAPLALEQLRREVGCQTHRTPRLANLKEVSAPLEQEAQQRIACGTGFSAGCEGPSSTPIRLYRAEMNDSYHCLRHRRQE